MPGRTKKKTAMSHVLVQYGRALEIRPSICKYQGDAEGAKMLFLECKQIYAEVYGKYHNETLDAARRAQNVGQEWDDGVHSGFR